MLRVAVLDDDFNAAVSVSELLTAYGLDAQAFATPAAMLARARDDRFAAFVIDWGLGTVTAAPSIAELRNSGYQGTPIVVLTGELTGRRGSSSNPAMQSASRTWGFEIRSKPYPGARLATELRCMVDAAAALDIKS